MRNYKVRDRVLVKLSGGRIVQATIKAVVDTTEGLCLQVSFGDETARIYEWRSSLKLVDLVRSTPIVEERRVRRKAED